ncbi:MAG: HNH endonuclease [Bacteroidota bacterium]
MKFQLKKFNRYIEDQELLDDLTNTFVKLRKSGRKLTFRSYDDFGNYTAGTISARFGSWNEALKLAGLKVNEEKDVDKKDLFKNLENVWIAKGEQPVWRDMEKNTSRYGPAIYKSRFGSWLAALEEFVIYINSDNPNEEPDSAEEVNEPIEFIVKRSKRNISDRLRFRILVRDGFICQSCGASPLKKRGVELHVDHIIPWSKGGETVDENLETKCSHCNLGKGNAFDK